jgi:predicted Zn-dependent protease
VSGSSADLAERALAASRADATVVLVEQTSEANLRFANSTLTTNGAATGSAVTVVAVVGGSAGAVRRAGVTPEELDGLAAEAERVAREMPAAEDAGPLVDGDADPQFGVPPEETSIEVLSGVAASLPAAFDAARSAGRRLYGFAWHQVTTTYLATSTGVRRRHVQPTGTIDMTGRSEDGSASAWAGRATRDFADVDVQAIAGEVAQRLDWSQRRLELPAGRYQTLVPPSAAADLLAELYWSMSARGAHEGRTAFARPGGGTRVGERVATQPVSLRSDPNEPGLGCAPFVATAASSEYESVFDNGLPIGRTDWITGGEITALMTSRHTAALTGLPVQPPVDNLVLETADPGPDLEQMVRSSDRALLLTCLWYIREVDPETLLVTGLTRDGVFLVEHGEVVGVVNNFRFNESPLDLLSRLDEVGPASRTLPREFQEYLPRVAAPPLRVPDFHMSSVSRAS